MQKLSLLGRNVTVLGQSVTATLDGACACLSPGSDPDAPSFAYKGDKQFPNEDGLLILKEGTRWLFAIADGHLGHQCSHQILETLAQPRNGLPTRPGQLALWISGIEWGPEAGGGSTLLVACLEETSGEVFGFSFGDSSLVTVGESGSTVRNRLNDVYVRTEGPIPMELALPFQFVVAPSETLLVYTDGINECCYRDPFRSVQLSHLHQQFLAHQGAAEGMARSILDLALQGVDGHPGGQDNVALIAWQRPA